MNGTVCQTGSSGHLCGVCDPGYFLDGSDCQECKVSRALFYGTLLLVVLGTIVAGTLSCKRFLSPKYLQKTTVVGSAVMFLRSIDVQRCKIAWVTVSIIGSISWTTKIIWPPPLSHVAGFYSSLSEFSFVPVSCIDATVTFYSTLIISTCVPLGLVAISWTCTVVNPGKVSRERAIQFTLLVAFLVLPYTTARIFQTFICTSFADGSKMLTTDLRLECEGPLYDGMFSFACIQCAVYPVGVPCLFLSVLWTHRKLITGRDPSLPCPQELRHIAILFKYYSNDAYYWEVVECVRRLMLSSVIVFMGEATGARSTWGTFLSITFSLACRECEPCQDTITQAFTFVCYWIVSLKE